MDSDWIKAKRSNPSGNCVEVRVEGGIAFIRNSRFPATVMEVPMGLLQDLVHGAKEGEFDDLLMAAGTSAQERLLATFPGATEVVPVGGWVSGSCPDPVKPVPAHPSGIDKDAALRTATGQEPK